LNGLEGSSSEGAGLHRWTTRKVLLELLQLAAILVIETFRRVEARKHGWSCRQRHQGRQGPTNKFVGCQSEEIGHADELSNIRRSLVFFKSGNRLTRCPKQFGYRRLRQSEMTPRAPKVVSYRHSYWTRFGVWIWRFSANPSVANPSFGSESRSILFSLVYITYKRLTDTKSYMAEQSGLRSGRMDETFCTRAQHQPATKDTGREEDFVSYRSLVAADPWLASGYAPHAGPRFR